MIRKSVQVEDANDWDLWNEITAAAMAYMVR